AYHAARETSLKPVAFGNPIVLGLLLGWVLAIGCVCVIWLGDVTFSAVPKGDLALASLAIPFTLTVLSIQSVYQGFRSFRAFNRITMAQAAIPLPLIGIAILLGGEVRAAIVAMVVASVLLFVAVVVYARRSTPIAWRLEMPYVRALAWYG